MIIVEEGENFSRENWEKGMEIGESSFLEEEEDEGLPGTKPKELLTCRDELPPPVPFLRQPPCLARDGFKVEISQVSSAFGLHVSRTETSFFTASSACLPAGTSGTTGSTAAAPDPPRLSSTSLHQSRTLTTATFGPSFSSPINRSAASSRFIFFFRIRLSFAVHDRSVKPPYTLSSLSLKENLDVEKRALVLESLGLDPSSLSLDTLRSVFVFSRGNHIALVRFSTVVCSLCFIIALVRFSTALCSLCFSVTLLDGVLWHLISSFLITLHGPINLVRRGLFSPHLSVTKLCILLLDISLVYSEFIKGSIGVEMVLREAEARKFVQDYSRSAFVDHMILSLSLLLSTIVVFIPITLLVDALICAISNPCEEAENLIKGALIDLLLLAWSNNPRNSSNKRRSSTCAKLFDVDNGLRESGPCTHILSIVDGGVAAGLPENSHWVASQTVGDLIQTVLGAATMVSKTWKHPGCAER
ncbi:unnamed protein product [Cochlearia groenlandica]